MFVFFVNHNFDLIYYLRLIQYLNISKNKIEFIFNKRISNQKKINQFINKELDFKYHIIDFKENNSSKLTRIFIYWRINNHFKCFSKNSTLIILDKSKLSSRYLIKKFENIILVQKDENFNDYILNIKATLIENIKSIISQTIPVLIYSDETKYSKLVHTLGYYDKYIIKSNISLLPKLQRKENGLIILFGSMFYSWNFVEKKYIEEFVKKILEHIILLNPQKKIHYIPHPRENGNEFLFIKEVFGSNIIMTNNYINAEHFLIKNQIDKTYSIGSTSSISSHELGYISYVFYKMLNIKKSNMSAFDNVLRDLPKHSFVKNFNKEKKYKITQKFDSSLINKIQKYDKEY